MAAVTANPGSPAVVLTPDDTGMSPLDDALLQLVLQTLTESSLEQIQEHQQRQQQGQQQRQLEAMDRQLTLQVQAQQSQQQAPSGLAESHTQQQTDVSASEASAAGREGLTQPVLNGSTAEQSLHQVDMSVSEAREAMLKNLAQNALTNLHHEQQQQQEQQQLLQQQEEVYEQQQCLLEQQSAVYDALLQQQQWELAQQQQQVYAEQQKLIEQQQSMLEALQQQQQLAVAAYQAGQEASKLDHNGAMCMKHGTGASDKAPCEQRSPDPHDTPDQSFSAQPPSQPTLSDPSSPPPMPAQRSAHDQPAQSPATLPAHAEAATQAAPHLPCSQPGEGLHINHSDTPHPQTAPGYPSAAASTAAARSAITGEQPPTSRTQLVSQHSDASSGHSNLQPSVPATSAALHSLLLQPWAQPGPLPQAYFLIPASEYQASGLLVLPATLLSPVPALPPAAYAPISAQHAIDAQLPAAVSQVHHEQQQQGTCSTDVLAKVGAGSVGGVGCEDSEASQVFTSASHQQPGRHDELTHSTATCPV